MAETFFIADTHFGHQNALLFRPQFKTLEEHDEHIIERWNSVVRPQDTVYHLGDVVMNRRCLESVARLNGKKHLVMGNHDDFPWEAFSPYFERPHGVKVFPGRFVCSHVPVHPSSLDRWGFNVHGHLHDKELDDPRYLCVSLEQCFYTPIPLPKVLEILGNKKGGGNAPSHELWAEQKANSESQTALMLQNESQTKGQGDE